MIHLKSQKEIESMRKAGRILAEILEDVASKVASGMTTADLDRIAEEGCKKRGVIPAFKGYKGFPGCMCISVNEEVVHGIPSKKKALKDGDIVGLDFGVILDGWYADSARTVPVGVIPDDTRQLVDVTKESLYKGIAECRPGNRVMDIGFAVQNYVEAFGYGVVREFVGHGIGRSLHEEPQVPNYGVRGKGALLKAGMVLAIEPMINAGSPEVKVLEDGWTAVTRDRSLSAHFEHTVAITDQGPEILTVIS